ncbi:MAG: hypothetical protein M0P69_18410 [Bacteroidales bacterium]|jgi:hypothetical protein|nr:hypothetical protein [Bacteroidales bacterium]
MARCKHCKGIDSFEHVVQLADDMNLYQCVNCKSVVTASQEEMNDEYRLV